MDGTRLRLGCNRQQDDDGLYMASGQVRRAGVRLVHVTGGIENRLNIAANRRSTKWTRREMLGRFLWEVLQPVTRLVPRQLWGVRNGILRLFGARVGRNVRIHRSARIASPWNLKIGDEAAIGDDVRIYNLGMITIGSKATVSQGAHLCAGTHDYRKPDFPLSKCTIGIGSGAWICADAFIGPNVLVGDLAIVGARAVVIRNVAPGTVVAGNPAQVIGKRQVSAEARS
jgi:putative colanic acid biosynthesis acetyltransferase WcaF